MVVDIERSEKERRTRFARLDVKTLGMAARRLTFLCGICRVFLFVNRDSDYFIDFYCNGL